MHWLLKIGAGCMQEDVRVVFKQYSIPTSDAGLYGDCRTGDRQ